MAANGHFAPKYKKINLSNFLNNLKILNEKCKW